MPLDIIVGAQWGDEGKGRMVDLLSAQADYVARYSGGDNAGHTVTVGEQIFKLHLLPSGLIHPHTVGVLGNGMVINPATLLAEMERIRAAGIEVNPERLRISYAAHLITPAHLALDQAQEHLRGDEALGTTLRGIGPAYTDKVARHGLRVEQMLDLEGFAEAVREHVASVNQTLTTRYSAEPLDPEAVAAQYADYAHQLTPYIEEASALLHGALQDGRRVLAEGAQGTLLDLDHGTYPFVTSSTPTAAGAMIGLGLGIKHVERIIGVTKVFQTRVGAGPFPTEVTGELAERLRGTGSNPWDEFGTTTGRPRRVGWLDIPLLRYAARVNGLTELALTKLDILSGLRPLKLSAAYREGDHTHPEPTLGPADLTPFEPVYEELPGWEAEVMEVRQWDDLPAGAKEYVRRIEALTGLPVRIISVGPERTQVVQIS